MVIYCKLNSMENEAHTHRQDAVPCKIIKGSVMDSDVIVETPNGIKCSAIFNPFAGWFADDVYGRKEVI